MNGNTELTVHHVHECQCHCHSNHTSVQRHHNPKPARREENSNDSKVLATIGGGIIGFGLAVILAAFLSDD